MEWGYEILALAQSYTFSHSNIWRIRQIYSKSGLDLFQSQLQTILHPSIHPSIPLSIYLSFSSTYGDPALPNDSERPSTNTHPAERVKHAGYTADVIRWCPFLWRHLQLSNKQRWMRGNKEPIRRTSGKPNTSQRKIYIWKVGGVQRKNRQTVKERKKERKAFYTF